MNKKFVFKYQYLRNHSVEDYESSEYSTREEAENAQAKLIDIGYEVDDIEELRF